MAKLVLLNSERAGQEFPLEPGKEYLLGRDDDCDILLRNVPGVSRRHAKFLQEGGDWAVRDLGSQNGIYYKKEKIDGRVLKDQDTLWFSNASIRFDAAAADPGKKNVYFKSSEPEDKPEKTQVEDDEDVEIKSPAAEEPPPAAEPEAQPEPKPEPDTPPAEPEVDVGEVDPEKIKQVREYFAAIEKEFSKVIVGQKDVLKELLIALLANGHCLMIGLPGLAKTLMVSTLSQILDLRFKRIQFTPDLMPSDIIGSDVLEMDEETSRKTFRFIEGPIFTNMLLADEINRTPPKTQAALLEAMQERQVSASNQLFKLPEPFFVLATQNPLEQEGTYPLPEAQLDRFMFNIIVDYPSEIDEEDIVMQTTARQTADVKHVLAGEELLQLQAIVRDLPVSRHVVKFATRLTRSTRPEDERAPDYIKEHVSCGAGPRSAQFLVLGAKARAVLDGRLNVSCQDVKDLALPIMRHRIFTNFTADSEGIKPDDLIKRLLLTVAEPGASDY